MFLLELLGGILGFGMNLIMWIIRIVLALIVAGIAAIKGRNALVWGFLTLFIPWTFIIIFFVGKKYPKLPRQLREHPAFVGKDPAVASIMALSAIIAKANGTISKEEIKFIKEFFMKQFHLGPQEINGYADAFDYGKTHPEEYNVFAEVVKGYCSAWTLNMLAYLFVGISIQGEDNGQKESETKKILYALGILPYEYERLKAYLTGNRTGYGQGAYGAYGQGSYGQSGYQGYYGQAQSNESLIKKYTAVLGVSENASLQEVKKAYRKLVKEYHPDKLAASGMPDDYVEFANAKIREINEAYEYLEKHLS